MSEPAQVSPGVSRFIEDMAAQGAQVRIDGARLLYEVKAVGGALIGQEVTTGVSVDEVHGWPLSPPHWIHLPGSVTFPETNSDATDCPPGWLRHSREFGFLDTSVPPALAWLRHVRGFISYAIAVAA